MEMKNFKREFVERTKEIVDNTDKYGCPYDVTLLINCMSGLVTVPTVSREGKADKDDKFKDACVQKLKDMKVVIKSNDDEQLFRALKNSLSHIHIEPKNDNGLIASVFFGDKYPNKKEYHTEFIFTVEQLKEYTAFMAEEYLKINR